MLLTALLVVAILFGLPAILVVLARRGRKLQIASGLIAVITGLSLAGGAFGLTYGLPWMPLLAAALELLVFSTMPLGGFLLVLYPLGMIGFGLVLLFRSLFLDRHAAESKHN